MRRHPFVRPSRLSKPIENLLRRVLHDEKLARRELRTEPVHDLRVALRRCRSLADDFSDFDPHGLWRDLSKACRDQQSGLGELRDSHVIEGWVRKLGLAEGSEGQVLAGEVRKHGRRARRDAEASLEGFSRKSWKRWLHVLPERAGEIFIGESRLARLALKRLMEVRAFEKRWRRSRSAASWHRLRLAVKRFRYTVETLLPALEDPWSRKLKRLQDHLGKGHDLDVLRARILQLSRRNAFPPETRDRWLQLVAEKRRQEEAQYRRDVSLNGAANGQRPGKPSGNGTHPASRRHRLLWDDWREELERAAKISLASSEELAKSAATPG